MTVCVLEKRFEGIFADVDSSHAPGVAVGVSIAGRPVYRKGFGLANLETPLAITPRTKMRIYSITKHFTCLCYMLLCEEGKASLDDRVDRYIPELNCVSRGATIRQLMCHTSGLLDIKDIHWHMCGESDVLSRAEILQWYSKLNYVNFAPNTEWCYNNGAYQLLSIAIERILDQSLEEVFQERIFEPAGMYDTLLRRKDSDFVADSATMHAGSADNGYGRTYLPGDLAGEGGIVATVDDMLRWLTHMDKPRIGGAATWEAMTVPQRLTNGVSTGYGLGLFVMPYRGAAAVGHPGGGYGASAQMIKIPCANLDVIVIANRGDINACEYACQVVDACVSGLSQDDVPSTFELSQGTFISARSGRVVQLYIENKKQMASLSGGWGFQLKADQEGVLRSTPAWNHCQCGIWVVGGRKFPDAIRFQEIGKTEEFKRVSPPKDAYISSISGSYRCAITCTRITISPREGGWLDSVGPFGSSHYRVRCLGENLLEFCSIKGAPSMRGILRFGKAGDTVDWSTERSRSVRFVREK